MPWGEATPRLAGEGLRPLHFNRHLSTRETPRKSWLSPQPSRGSRVGLTCKQAHPSIETTDLAAERTFRLDRCPVDDHSTVPGPKTRTRNPEERRVVVPSPVLSNRIEHLPCRSEPRPGPILPLMRPAFPWPHLPRGRLESVGATPRGGAFLPHREPPAPIRGPWQPVSDLGFPDRFPESPIERPLSATRGMYLIEWAASSVSTGAFSRDATTFRDQAACAGDQHRRGSEREKPRERSGRNLLPLGALILRGPISSANLPGRKSRWPQPVPCGFDCSRSGVASISVHMNLPRSIRVRQISGLVCFRAPRRVFAGAESHFCHSISV